MNKTKILSSILVLGFSVSACDPMKPAEVIMEARRLIGFPEKHEVPKEVNEDLATLSEKDPARANELAKENGELLTEVMRVVFNQENVDPRSFPELAHSLNQGASLEGIHQGLIYGSRYRALETKSTAASPTELKAFAIELADLQLSMKNPSVFSADAKKAPSIDYPDGSEAVVPVASAGSQVVEKKKDRLQLQGELLQTFIGASSYTLKRTLCEETLKKFEEVKDNSGDMAQWYANFALHMADTKVDFGLELRSKPDFDFHFKFAQKMALDRVKWEVLNRYHRYLNALANQP